MNTRQVISGAEGRKQVKVGIDRAAIAKVTLGAGGRNVMIENPHTRIPHSTKDGWTVVSNIHADDPVENMGVMLMKQVAGKTAEEAGDGTTTAIILCQSIIEQGMELIEAGENPVKIKKEIDAAVRLVVEEIKKVAQPANTIEILRQIATISANNDPVLGNMIADAVFEVGVNGSIEVKPSFTGETSVEMVKGMQLNYGWTTNYFATNAQATKCELENPLVLVCDKEISYVTNQLLPVVKIAMEQKRSLLVVCEDMNGEALGSLLSNTTKGTIRACVVSLKFAGNLIKEIMDDIAAVTGGMVVSDQKAMKLENVRFDPRGNNNHFGQATKVTVSKDKTVIIGGAAMGTSVVSVRVQSLEEQVKESNGHEKDLLKERLARISSSIGILKVGSGSDLEMKEKKDRVEDAICAVKAAMEEGYVAGAGATYQRCSKVLVPLGTNGNKILWNALQEPAFTIQRNSGMSYDTSYPNYGQGIDALTGEEVNLFEKGIIDPAKVSRIALENAASVASTFLTTEAIVI